jgi:hypothetical protein
MGVRGRRVAAVEQLTNTIISFAPVPPGQKDRTLTIHGTTQMELERAQMLIVETIQRNMSPIPMQASSNSKKPSPSFLMLKISEKICY